METVKQSHSVKPVIATPRYIEIDTDPRKELYAGQMERSFVVHNFTNQVIYLRDLHDFTTIVEPETTIRSRHTTIGPHIVTMEKYMIRGTNAVQATAEMVAHYSKEGTINKAFAKAFTDAYNEKIQDARERHGNQLDPSRIKNMTLSFSLIFTYTLDALRANPSTYCKESGLVVGFNTDTVAHVYPNSEFLSKTKDFSDGKFHHDELYSSIRLVDNHREIGDQYIWMLNGVRHIPAVQDSSVESGFYIVEPRACTGEVVHVPKRYTFDEAHRLFHIRSTQKEAMEVGNPLVSEEVAVKTIEKETKILTAQNKKEEVVDSSLKSMLERFIRAQTFHEEQDRLKEDSRLREEKLRMESEERERKALHEQRLKELEEEDRRRKAEFEEEARRSRLHFEEEDRRSRNFHEDLERRIKLEYEQRRVEFDRVSQLNKINTEKRLSRNKERSEKTKVFGDIMKAAPAIFLGALGLFAIFRSRSA